MNREEPHRDQAERLRHRVARTERKGNTTLSVSDLPPRSEVHRQTRKKTKWKLRYPIIRLLALFFILLPIIIFSIINYQKQGNGERVSNDGRDDFELVDFQDGENNATPDGEEGIGDNSEEEDNNDEGVVPSVEPDPNEISEEQSNTGSNDEEEENTDDKTENESVTDREKDSAGEKDGEEPSGEKIIYHKVQAKETLYRIAMKYYQSPAGIEIIKETNGIKGDQIQAGQTLKIPLK